MRLERGLTLIFSRLAAAALLAAWLCSCSSIDSRQTTDPFVGQAHEAGSLPAAVANKNRDSDPDAEDDMVARAQCPAPDVNGGAMMQCDPRAAFGGQMPTPLLGFPVGSMPVRVVDEYPDEYLWDGGDRDNPVHYGNVHRFGLDTEDTITEYVDHKGREHVEPSNRVAIYAPRFGAVRTVSSSLEHYSAEGLFGTYDKASSMSVRDRLPAVHHLQNDRMENMRVRTRPSGLETDRQPTGTHQVAVLAEHEKLLNVFQDLNFVRSGEIVRTEEARLASAVEAAFVWTRDQYPVIAAVLAGSQELSEVARLNELAGTEDRKTPGRLRIVKLADKKVARSGDVVTFTIRYDNLGDRELYHVRILDNLTPRLQFVDGSATSDRDGRLVVEDNQEGSLVLRWEFADPLAGQQGGVVTFQARLR